MANKMFENTLVWQKSRILVKEIYNNFTTLPDYTFRSQILRCSLSIMNNIAEGMERHSQNELRQFLVYAKGSCGELRSMLAVAEDVNYLPKTTIDKLNQITLEQSRILHGFITRLNKNKTPQ